VEEVIQKSKEPLSAMVKPKMPWQIRFLFCAGQCDNSARLAVSGRLANGYSTQAVHMCVQPNIGSTDEVCQHTLHSKSGEQRCWARTTAVLLQNSTQRGLHFNVSLCCTCTSLLWSFAIPQGDSQSHKLCLTFGGSSSATYVLPISVPATQCMCYNNIGLSARQPQNASQPAPTIRPNHKDRNCRC